MMCDFSITFMTDNYDWQKYHKIKTIQNFPYEHRTFHSCEPSISFMVCRISTLKLLEGKYDIDRKHLHITYTCEKRNDSPQNQTVSKVSKQFKKILQGGGSKSRQIPKNVLTPAEHWTALFYSASTHR